MALAYRHSATSVARHVLTLTLDRYRLPACWIHTEGNAREVDGGNHDRPLVQVDLEDSVISRPNTISSLTQTEGGSDSGNQGVLAAAMGPSAWSPTGIPRIPTAITPELSSSTVDRAALAATILRMKRKHHRDMLHAISAYTSTLDEPYLSSLSSPDLKAILRDLQKVARHATPTRWTYGLQRPHRSIRLAFGAIIRCLDELKERGQAEGVMRPWDFDVILSSLARRPFIPKKVVQQEVENPEHQDNNVQEVFESERQVVPFPIIDQHPTTTAVPLDPMDDLTIPSVLELLTSLGLTPTVLSLRYIAEASSNRLVPTLPRAKSHREKLGLTHASLVEGSAEVWSDRLGLMDSFLAAQDLFRETSTYSGEVMTTMDEADIILGGFTDDGETYGEDEVSEVNDKLAIWKERRNALIPAKMDVLRSLLEDMSQSGAIIATTREEVEAVLFLLRHSLLPKSLQWDGVATGTTSAPHNPQVFNNPVELMKLLLGYRQANASAPITGSAYSEDPRRAAAIGNAILHCRNSYYVHGHFDKLLDLIHLLTSTTTSSSAQADEASGSATTLVPIPRLPGKVHSALLTTATNPDQFRQLLLRLSHLPPPHSPPSLSHTSRKLLFVQARISQKIPWPSEDPALKVLAPEMRDALVLSGWAGLIMALFEKWGVGIPSDMWRKYLKAVDTGDEAEQDKLKGEMREWRRARPFKRPSHEVYMTQPLTDPLLVRRPATFVPR